VDKLGETPRKKKGKEMKTRLVGITNTTESVSPKVLPMHTQVQITAVIPFIPVLNSSNKILKERFLFIRRSVD
jgi:hypothetical protein